MELETPGSRASGPRRRIRSSAVQEPDGLDNRTGIGALWRQR